MGSTSVNRVARCGLATGAIVLGALIAVQASARAASQVSCTQAGQGDLDGNGQADLIVGAPDSNVVDIHYDAATTKVQRINSFTFAPSVGPYRRFGASTSVATDATQCKRLVIGAPDFGVPDNQSGRAIIAPVVNGKVTKTGLITLAADNPAAHQGDRFGATLAAHGQDIWVGAPGTTVGGVVGAGAVYHYRLTSGGTAQLIGEYTEKTPGIPGGPERNDGFGSVLSMDDAGAIAVGEPGEDVGRAQNAGTVTVIRTDLDTGAFSGAVTISQNTPGVGGAAEADFGQSLSMIDDR